jgi:hypothetical protein
LKATAIQSAGALLAALLGVAVFATAAAADPIFAPGEPIVTGFSGVVEPSAPPSGTDPLDLTFIDPDGKSLVIQQLEPDAPPSGQLIDAPAAFSATAADIGQVFGVTLDDAPDAMGADAPNIYVAATSAYGLNLVVPGPDGTPVRSRVGAADASFMPGQWAAPAARRAIPAASGRSTAAAARSRCSRPSPTAAPASAPSSTIPPPRSSSSPISTPG